MRKVFNIESYMSVEDIMQDIILGHREQFGDDPAVGVNNRTFYNICRRLRPRVLGGKTEPLYFDLSTVTGLARVFVDKACSDTECSVDEPDE